MPFLCLFLWADFSSKVRLTRACVPPSASDTKAEEERTHTKRMDIVKTEKIYKGEEAHSAHRLRRRHRNPLSPRLFSEDGSEKEMLFWGEIQILSQRGRMKPSEKEERMRRCTAIERREGRETEKQVDSACQIIHVSISENNLMYYWYI